MFIFSFSITLCFDSTKSPIPEVDWSHCILDPTKGRQEQGIPELSCVVKVAQQSSAYWLTSLVTYINVHLNVSYNSGNCKLPHNFIFSAAIDTIYNTCRTRDTMSTWTQSRPEEICLSMCHQGFNMFLPSRLQTRSATVLICSLFSCTLKSQPCTGATFGQGLYECKKKGVFAPQFAT